MLAASPMTIRAVVPNCGACGVTSSQHRRRFYPPRIGLKSVQTQTPTPAAKFLPTKNAVILFLQRLQSKVFFHVSRSVLLYTYIYPQCTIVIEIEFTHI